ncbi:hypothetical protein ACK3TF_005740 [Chlorella vulgaris]
MSARGPLLSSRLPINSATGSRSGKPSQAVGVFLLALALFALVLQLSGREHEVVGTQLQFPRRDLMAQQQQQQMQLHQPKLELSLAHLESDKPKQPLPQGLGGQAWRPQLKPAGNGRPTVAFVVTTSDSLQQIRIWISYHKSIGVSNFYIFADGQAARADNVAALRSLPGITVVLRDAELRRRHENSRIWKESWLSAFFHKPCNHELFVLQSLNMEVGIEMALQDKVDWLLHVDTDELIFPAGSPAFSLQEVLGEVPADVDTLVFPNYESLPERDDVEDPFLEVTLFKKNYAHVVSDLYFKSYGTVARGNPNYFITYGNGKSAARVQQGMRPNGAHRWHSYVKTPKEWSSDQAAVLHFTYNRFSDLKSRRDRCDCAPTEEDSKRCFILPFDRMAFLEASLKNDTELMGWFRQHLVWSDPAVVNDLLKKGLFTRVYEPQLMIRGFIAAEKAAEKEAAETARLKQQLEAAQASALQATTADGGTTQGALEAADPGAGSVGAAATAQGFVQGQLAAEQVAGGSVKQQQQLPALANEGAVVQQSSTGMAAAQKAAATTGNSLIGASEGAAAGADIVQQAAAAASTGAGGAAGHS